ncbi:hypothetical protein OUZ56_011422 [Daphnia magna]|uniref:Uncharacterized protein n=1 Tax=Daphnia magna TaxID=35525 RepID=A0ABQ9Z0A2_9CRUS|nr:hypothetical protein OUZ56_011422 [Daphnia magna]
MLYCPITDSRNRRSRQIIVSRDTVAVSPSYIFVYNGATHDLKTWFRAVKDRTEWTTEFCYKLLLPGGARLAIQKWTTEKSERIWSPDGRT